MPSVFFIGSESPSIPDKTVIDYSVAYANGRSAIDAAKAKAKQKYGEQVVIRTMSDERVGVFIDVQGDLALLFIYFVKSVELLK